MRELCPACPPVAVRSTRTVRSPSDAPYTAAAEPGRPAADRRPGRRSPATGCVLSPTRSASSVSAGAISAVPSGVTTSGSSSAVRPGRGEQAQSFGRVGGVPPVRHLVAGQELADLRRAGRPAMAHHLRLRDRAVVARGPGLQLRVDDRVELLLGRIPRLEQVVVEVDDVDRLDRGAGVGVGRQQDAPRAGVDVHRRFEELQPAHLRHAVVGQQDRDRVAAQLHLRAARPAPARRTRRARCGGCRRSGGAGRGPPPATRWGRRRRSATRCALPRAGRCRWANSRVSLRTRSGQFPGLGQTFVPRFSPRGRRAWRPLRRWTRNRPCRRRSRPPRTRSRPAPPRRARRGAPFGVRRRPRPGRPR